LVRADLEGEGLKVEAVADTWHLFLKYTRITLRMPMWTLFGLVQPLIWLVIFGQLFSHFARMAGFPSESYLEFLTPGIVVMTVLFGSSWSGVNLLREITYGTVEKMMVTAVHRPAIVLSRVLHNGVLVVLQVGIVLSVAAGLGAPIRTGIGGLGLLVAVVFGMGLGFASLSNAIALKLRREEPLVMAGNLMTLPLMFFTSAFIPKVFMPSWIAALASVNPVHYGVEASRTLLAGHGWDGDFWLAICVVAAFSASALGWSMWLFMRQRT
jgi:ABC-2 type transport system permease protein